MKKSGILISAFLMMLIVFSCEKDPSLFIVGEWKVVDIAYSEKASAELEIALKESMADIKATTSWKINENGTFTQTISEQSSNGKWVMSPDRKKLTLTYEDGKQEVSDIIELTETKLVVSYRIDETEYKNTYEKKLPDK